MGAKKDEIMDELVKEIEELENEVRGNSEVDTDKEKEADGGGIDWGSSALSEIITDKEKEERKKKKGRKLRRRKKRKSKMVRSVMVLKTEKSAPGTKGKERTEKERIFRNGK